MSFSPNSLLKAARDRSRHALACGALQPIDTEQTLIDDGPVRFPVRIVSSLTRKEAQKKLAPQPSTGGRPHNPFLPYDPDLFVADLSPTHVCLLNKFKVIDHHLLIVTRGFEPQENSLTLPDFRALWRCLNEFDSLGFYNSGAAAGASQPHKHLQLVPLPLGPGPLPLPIQPLIDKASSDLDRLPSFPFLHAFTRLRETASPGDAPDQAHQVYQTCLQQLRLQTGNAAVQTAPYNLLTTRHWMLLVPRSRESCGAVSINALGFAGSFFVRNQAALETLQSLGPINALTQVAIP